MAEDTNGKKRIENRGENLVDTTNEYNKDGRPQDEPESVLNETVDKVKAATKAVTKKVEDTSTDMSSI